MAEPQIIQCPECQAKLALKNGRHIGDRVRCSYCYQSFVIDVPGGSESGRISPSPPVLPAQENTASQSPRQRRPRPAVEYDELVEIEEQPRRDDSPPEPEGRYWTSFDDLASKPKPVRKPVEDETPRNKKNALAPWMVPVLVLFGIIFATSLLGGVIFYGIMSSNTNGDNLDLAYLPPDSELIVSIRVDTTWNSEFIQGLIRQPEIKSAFDMWKLQTRMGPGDSIEDIKSITVGFSGIGNPRFGGFDPIMAETIIVIRSKNRIDTSEARHFGDKKRYKKKTYYVGKHGSVAGLAFFFPDSRTMVIGTHASLYAAIDRGDRTVSRPELNYVDSSRHALFIYTPKDQSVFDVPENQWNTEPLQRFTNVVENHLQSVCVGVSFLEDIHVQIQGNCSDSGSAAELRNGMDQILREMSVQLEQARHNLPDLLAPMATQGEAVLQSATVTLDEKTVSLTATIPANSISAFSNFQQTLPMLMAMQAEGDDGNFAPDQAEIPEQNERGRPDDRAGKTTDEPNENSLAQDADPSEKAEKSSSEPEPDDSNPGNMKLFWLVEFELGQYSGEGTQLSAARQVLRQFSEVPPPSINIIPGLNIIRCIVRGNKPITKSMKTALQASGFEIGEVSVR